MFTPEQRNRTAIMGIVTLLIMAVFFFKIPVCLFALITHHPCPGCGLTRATKALLHGDILSSLRHHPLALIVSPVVAFTLVRNGLGYILRGRWGEGERVQSRAIKICTMLLLIALIGVWIARFFGAFGGPEPV